MFALIKFCHSSRFYWLFFKARKEWFALIFLGIALLTIVSICRFSHVYFLYVTCVVLCSKNMSYAFKSLLKMPPTPGEFGWIVISRFESYDRKMFFCRPTLLIRITSSLGCIAHIHMATAGEIVEVNWLAGHINVGFTYLLSFIFALSSILMI